MAVFDELEILQSDAHDLGAWLSVVSVPGSEAGDDPGGVGESALGVRVLLTLRLAFQLRRKSLQEGAVGGIEGLLEHLIGGAVASPNQLQDGNSRHSYGADQARHSVGVFNLCSLDVKASRLQGAEIILNDPAPTVEVEHHASHARTVDRMSGDQPPMDRLTLLRRRRLPDVQERQRNSLRQVRRSAI